MLLLLLLQAMVVIQKLRKTAKNLKLQKEMLTKRRDEYLSIIAPGTDCNSCVNVLHRLSNAFILLHLKNKQMFVFVFREQTADEQRIS